MYGCRECNHDWCKKCYLKGAVDTEVVDWCDIEDPTKFDSDLIPQDKKKAFSDLMIQGFNGRVCGLERVYHASVDGFEAQKFHSTTDSISQRIIIIKNEFDVIFGGYVSKSCNDIPDKWLDDPTAFLYQFDPESKIFRTKEANGII